MATEANRRLSVLHRQLASSPPSGSSELYAWLVHDNEESRSNIFEHLKVGARGMTNQLASSAARMDGIAGPEIQLFCVSVTAVR